jgi:hypothetical protein
VQVRILRARRPVLVGGRDEPGAALTENAVLAPARHAGALLEFTYVQ